MWLAQLPSLLLPYLYLKLDHSGNPLSVEWLRLCTFIAAGMWDADAGALWTTLCQASTWRRGLWTGVSPWLSEASSHGDWEGGISRGLDWGSLKSESQGRGLLPCSKGSLVPSLPMSWCIHGLCSHTAGPGPPLPALPARTYCRAQGTIFNIF